MSHPATLNQLIEQNSHLFWFVPLDKRNQLSQEVLFETIVNYGDMAALKDLINILGVDNSSRIFNRINGLSERRKGNINEITRNFLEAFFNRHATPDS